MLIVPDRRPEPATWQPGSGNLFFEVHRSAVETFGESNVVLADLPDADWHAALLHAIADSGATHVVAQIEADPDRPDDWSWDVVVDALARTWDGVLVGVMYDSAYEWLRHRARRLGRMWSRFLIADLCVPMDGFVRPDRPEVGPMTMPFSQASLATVDAHVHGLPKEHEVTFVGTLYEYRVNLIDPILAAGIDVVINPHRPDAPTTTETPKPPASYLDYMRALAVSETTINFAEARGGPHEQYKIRVHEAALVGCLVLTDDRDRTRHFFGPDQFREFSGPDSMLAVLEDVLGDPAALRAAQQSARERARVLTGSDFWGRINDGCRRRGLPPLSALTAPPEPGERP